MSDPLDQYCTREEFFSELLQLLHEPLPPWDLPALKDVEVKPCGPSEAIIKIILDGDMMRELNYPDKPQIAKKDIVRVWLRLEWDTTKYELNVHSHDNATGKEKNAIRMYCLKDPFRIEALFTLNVENLDITVLAWLLENHWVRPVVGAIKSRKVAMRRNVTSPFGNGDMVTVSDSLDGLIDFNSLWEEYLSMQKSWASSWQPVSDSQFEVTIRDGRLGGSEAMPLVRLIKHDKSKGEIIDVASMDNLRLVDTRHILMHQDPLRVELWTEAGGKRVFRRINVELLQTFLDSAVKQHRGRGAAVGQHTAEVVKGAVSGAQEEESLCVAM